MSCSPAPLCKKGLADATATWPDRSRGSDGICGDEAHQSRPSDHNAGNAFDLTHDPAAGCDAHAQAEAVKAENPPWVTYIISDHRIWNPDIAPGWRPYTGSNPHTQHAHFSIDPAYRDDQPVFPWTAVAAPDEEDTMQLIGDFNGQLHYFYVGDGGDLWHAWWGHSAPYGRQAERIGDVDDYDGQPSATVIGDTMHVVCDRSGSNPPAHHFFTPAAGWATD